MIETMYPAAVNSRQTELAQAINETQTSFTVLDGTVLPPAPNELTLGTDESAETVRYTGLSGNIVSGVTRGFEGTAKSWAVGTKLARYFTAYDHNAFKSNIEDLDTRTGRVDLTANLGPGSSVINADQASDLDLTVYGQTRVNLLGDTGNFENDTNADGVADGWTGVLNSSTATIETTSKYGFKSQRITSKASDSSPFRRVERTVNLKTGKRYLFMSDVVTDGIGACKINAQYSSGTTIESVQSTVSKVHFIKLSPTEDTVATVRLYNYTPIGTVAWVQFDGAGVFEVPDDLYNRIGVDITETNIRDYLPHVDGKQHVNGVIVTKQGKNLLPAVPDVLHSNAKANGPYDMILTATAATQQSSLVFNVIPNTKYILSGLLTGVGARVYIHTLDASGNPNYGTSVASLTETISTSAFATDANTTKLFIRFSNSAAGSFTFKNWQLEIGSVATQFEFADPQRLILPVTLATTPDGSVRDTAYYRDGSWRKMQRVDISVDPAVALTTPVESEIAKAEGAISLHPAGNQITVETGVIQREKVTFNATTKQGTTAKRSARVTGVYKGANLEPYTTYTSGSQTLPQLVNAVESGKDYYVTYMALDKYALTANVTQVDAKYVKGLSGTMSDVVRDVARLGQQNSRQDFADVYIQAMAENLRVDIGVTSDLTTTNKTNVVAAINEVALNYIRQPGYAVTTGAAAAYVATLNPVPGSLPDGFGITIVPHVTNGASPTLNVNGLGAVPLKDQKGISYAAGKLVAGKPYTFRKVGSDFLADSSGGSGTAVAGDIRAGKTATNDDGDVVGTLVTRNTSQTNITPGSSAQTLQSGIYDYPIVVSAVPAPVQKEGTINVPGNSTATLNPDVGKILAVLLAGDGAQAIRWVTGLNYQSGGGYFSFDPITGAGTSVVVRSTFSSSALMTWRAMGQ